jgi:hypothetical protein
VEHQVSLAPIAEVAYAVPTPDQITCTEQVTEVAEVPLLSRPVAVTESGYVGATYVGHRIHHLLPGTHHVVVIGEGRLSIVEPEAGRHWTYAVPESLGVTWTDEGLLGLIATENSEFVVYALREIRRGTVGGFQAEPSI